MVNIGIIGVGSYRSRLALYLKDNPKVKVIGGADINPDIEKDFREVFGEDKIFTLDYKELLANKEINTIMVVSPDFLHYEHAIAALRAGKHIFLEKPMGITIEECDDILKVAHEVGKKIFIGHNMRYFDSILKMKEIIDSGKIGEVQAIWCRHFVSYGGDAYFKDWHSQSVNTTGLLLQKGAHDIDIIHWLAGGYTEKVVGMGKLSVYNKVTSRQEDPKLQTAWFDRSIWPPETQKNLAPKIDIEDHNMILMQLDNGVQASYMQCFYTPDSVRNYTVIGSKGRIENIGDMGNCKVVVFDTRSDSYGEPDIVYNIKAKEGGHGGADPCLIKDFAEFILNEKNPNINPIAARNAVATGVKATEALRGDLSVKVIEKLPEELIEYYQGNQVKK